MIIQKEVDEKFASNIDNKTSFTIKASAKAFSILSSNLYKNSIRAGIRELSCNAIDAHIANNYTKPFEVKLPDEFDTTFYVKDFGIGMTEQELVSVFTTYFESTKNNSNDMIGGLGLGSKSPYAYTSQYMIESAKNGEKVTAFCYLDNDKLPNLSIVNREPCNYTGTKVSYNIEQKDIKSFSIEAFAVFMMLPVMPNITNANVMYENQRNAEHIDEATFLAIRNFIATDGKEGDSFSNLVYSLIENHYGEDMGVIMGGVFYPISIYELFTDNDEYKQSFQRILRNSLKLFHAEIGSLSINPSREALVYDKLTKSTLEKIAYDNVKTCIKELFDNSSNTFATYYKILFSPCADFLTSLFDLNLVSSMDVESYFSNIGFEKNFLDSTTIDNIKLFCIDLNTINEKLKSVLDPNKVWGLACTTDNYRHFEINEQPACKVQVQHLKSKNKHGKFIVEFANFIRYHKFVYIATLPSEKYSDFVNKRVTEYDRTRTEKSQGYLKYFERIFNDKHSLNIPSKMCSAIFQKNEQPLNRDNSSVVILVKEEVAEKLNECGIMTDFALFDLEPVIFPKKKSEKRKLNSERVFTIVYTDGGTDTRFVSLDDLMAFSKKGFKVLTYIHYLNSTSSGIFDENVDYANMTAELANHKVFDYKELILGIEQIKPTGFLKKKIIAYVGYGEYKRLKLRENKKITPLLNAYYDEVLKKGLDKIVFLKDNLIDFPNYFNQKVVEKKLEYYSKVYLGFENTYFYKIALLAIEKNKFKTESYKMRNHNSKIEQLLNIYSQYSLAFKNIKEVQITALVKQYNNLVNDLSDSNKISKQLDKLYPLLAICHMYQYSDKQIDDIFDYVVLQEGLTKVEQQEEKKSA